MSVELTEAKAAFESLAKDFEEFKKTNEAKLAALKREKSDAMFEEKLDRINDAMTKQERIIREFHKQEAEREEKRAAQDSEQKVQTDEWIKKIEARVNRSLLGLGGAELPDGKELLAKKSLIRYVRKGVEHMTPDEVKVLVVSNDTGAGYLAPSDFERSIIKAQSVFSPVRDLVTVVDISGPSLKQPTLTGSIPAATRVGEITSRSESTNPTYGMVDIQCPEMYAEHRVSNQQLEDAAFDIEAELSQFMGWQFASKEGAEFITGTGVNQCQGLQSAGLTAVASTDADEITADGVIDLVHALPTPYARGAVLLLNRKSLGKIRKLKASTSGEYVWQRGYDLANPPTIAGEQYVEVPDMDDEGTDKYPVAFGNFKLGYKLVQKTGSAFLRDPYTLQSTGQVKISARRRVGGMVVLTDAIRMLKCATSV